MAISIERLTKRYGQFIAVNQINFEAKSGEVFGFLGPNGAGKTTTIRMIAGLLRPSEGRVVVDGYDVQREPRLAKRSLGFVPDEPHLFDGLTGREFIEFIGELYGVPVSDRRDRGSELIERFELGDHIDQAIGSYSHGTRQKLALTGALIHRPSNLLLDEPTVGLDPRAAFTLKETLRDQAATGGTVFLSTHILEIAQGICDRIGIISRGRLLAVGTLEELRGQAGDPSLSLEAIFLRLTDQAADDKSVATVTTSPP